MEDKEKKKKLSLKERMRKTAKYCTSSVGKKKPPDNDSDISDILSGIWTEDQNMQLFAMQSVQSLCFFGQLDPIITSSVPRFVEFLMRNDYQLQSAAASTLACIAVENANIVIQHGAIPILVNLIFSYHDDVCEQALWALGNLAPESPDLVLDLLISFVTFADGATKSKYASWTLSNFCAQTPTLDVLPALARLIYATDDDRVLADACWTLSHIFYATDDIPEDEFRIIPKVVQLLQHQSPSVIIYALRTVGNIVAKSESQTQAIIGYGALSSLWNLLKGEYCQSIKKAACWTISNIVAENKENNTKALFDAGITSLLVKILLGDPICKEMPNFVVKQEAAWAISNAIYVASSNQIDELVLEDCVMALSKLLQCYDPRIVEVCLEGLNKMAESGSSFLVLRKLEEYDGIVNIMRLRELHPDPHVRQKAKMFMESHWRSILVDYDFVDYDETSSPSRSTVAGAKRIDPCPPPFPIIYNERLHPGLDFCCLKESKDVRAVNAYLDETRPIKRRPKWEDTSLIKDVRFRYYHGQLAFEGYPIGLTNLVHDLSERIVIQIDLDQTNSEIFKMLSKMGIPDGKDVVREFRRLTDLLKKSNGHLCLDVYDFGTIDLSDKSSLARNEISNKLNSLLLE